MPTLYPGGPTLNPDGSFTVRRGDSLSLYSQGLYGDFNHINEFFRSNGNPPAPIPDKNRIVEGERLFHIPPGARPGPKDPAKEVALHMVDQFEVRTGAGAFTRISRAEVADGLRLRVQNPKLIDQGRAGLCPTASMVFLEAKARPVEYVLFVTNLFEWGRARLRQLDVRPGYFLKNYAPPPYVPGRTGVHVADWIPMASIRDSWNWFLPYADVDWWNSGANSWTMVAWLKRAGYTVVEDHTSIFFNETEANLLHADRLHRSGYKIILAIDANVFRPPPQRPAIRKGNHVVVLTTPVTFSGSPNNKAVHFKVYTWGSEREMKPAGYLGMMLSDFLNYYYGFIAAKY